MIDPTAPLRPAHITPPLANPVTASADASAAAPSPSIAGPGGFPQTASSLSVSPGATAQTHVSLIDASVATPEQDFARELSQRPLGETLRMHDFLKTYAATGARSVPADEMGMLQAIPQHLRNRLPEVLRELDIEMVSSQIHELDVEKSHQAGDLAERLHALTQGSRQAPTPEQLMDFRSGLSEPLQAIFDGLGLHQEGFRSKLPELSQRLEDVRTRQINFRAQMAQHLAENIGIMALSEPGAAPNPEIQAQRERMEASRYLASLNISENAQAQHATNRYEGISNMAAHARAVGRGIADQMGKMEDYLLRMTGPSGMPVRNAQGQIDLSGFKAELDLHAGHNAVVLRMFQRAGQHGAPSAEIQQLKDVLGRAQNTPSALNDADRELLRSFGIEVQDEKLLNIVTQAPLSAIDIDGLVGLQEEIVIGLSSGIKETAVAASGLAVTRFQTLLAQTDLVDKLEKEMAAGNQILAGLKAEAIENTQAQHSNREAQEQAAGQVQLAQERAADVDILAPFLKGDKAGIDALFDYALHRPELRNSLAALGVQITPPTAGVPLQIKVDGRITPLENAKQSVIGRFAELNRTLEAALSNLENLKREGQRLMARGKEIGSEIERESQAQEQRLAQHSTAISELESLNLDELETLAQDPAFLQQLADSPEARTRYQKALARARQQIARAPQVQQDTRREMDGARAAASDNTTARELMQEQLKQTQKLQDQVQKTLDKLAQSKDKALVTRLREAIAEANRLAAELILAPAPHADHLQQIQQQWMQELKALYSEAQQHLQQIRSQEQGAQSQESHFIERINEQASYHLKALEKMDQRQNQRILEALQTSLVDFQSLALLHNQNLA